MRIVGKIILAKHVGLMVGKMSSTKHTRRPKDRTLVPKVKRDSTFGTTYQMRLLLLVTRPSIVTVIRTHDR